MRQLTHGSLFSGIGGFDLAAEWMGWKNIFHCELNEFGQKILKHHFPNADSYSDITQTDFTKYEGSVSIISGGFPCQPFSQAGLRKSTEDERYLWDSMLRAIREVKPKYVIAENVSGLVSIDSGLVLKKVQSDLESEGFEVQCFVIGACAKNAPHKRQRIWIVAYSVSQRFQRAIKSGKTNYKTGKKLRKAATEHSKRLDGNTTNSQSISSKRQCKCGQGKGQSRRCNCQKDGKENKRGDKYLETNGSSLPFQKFPTEPPVCGGDDGIPSQLDNITIPKWRNESIMAYGNAIVPNVAHELFQVIQQLENLDK